MRGPSSVSLSFAPCRRITSLVVAVELFYKQIAALPSFLNVVRAVFSAVKVDVEAMVEMGEFKLASSARA